MCGNGASITLTELGLLKHQKLLDMFQSWNIYPKTKKCSICDIDMVLKKDERYIDKVYFVCENQIRKKNKRVKCNRVITIRKGTFLEGLNVDIKQMICFVISWISGGSVFDGQREAGLNISKNERVKYFEQIGGNITKHSLFSSLPYSIIAPSKLAMNLTTLCQQVVIDAVFTKGQPIGGAGVIVEIGVSNFGKQPNHRKGGRLVFGCVERKTSRHFMIPIENSEKETLLSIIKTWIKPGSIIVPDGSKLCADLTKHGYKELTDPDSKRAYCIKSLWRQVKVTLNFEDDWEETLTGFIARFIFAKKFVVMNQDAVEAFFRAANDFFNTNIETERDICIMISESDDEEESL